VDALENPKTFGHSLWSWWVTSIDLSHACNEHKFYKSHATFKVSLDFRGLPSTFFTCFVVQTHLSLSLLKISKLNYVNSQLNYNVPHIFHCPLLSSLNPPNAFFILPLSEKMCVSTVFWGNVLQSRRWRVRFLIGSLQFFVELIPPAALGLSG
jgi:hypothetical protein